MRIQLQLAGQASGSNAVAVVGSTLSVLIKNLISIIVYTIKKKIYIWQIQMK